MTMAIPLDRFLIIFVFYTAFGLCQALQSPHICTEANNSSLKPFGCPPNERPRRGCDCEITKCIRDGPVTLAGVGHRVQNPNKLMIYVNSTTQLPLHCAHDGYDFFYAPGITSKSVNTNKRKTKCVRQHYKVALGHMPLSMPRRTIYGLGGNQWHSYLVQASSPHPNSECHPRSEVVKFFMPIGVPALPRNLTAQSHANKVFVEWQKEQNKAEMITYYVVRAKLNERYRTYATVGGVDCDYWRSPNLRVDIDDFYDNTTYIGPSIIASWFDYVLLRPTPDDLTDDYYWPPIVHERNEFLKQKMDATGQFLEEGTLVTLHKRPATVTFTHCKPGAVYTVALMACRELLANETHLGTRDACSSLVLTRVATLKAVDALDLIEDLSYHVEMPNDKLTLLHYSWRAPSRPHDVIVFYTFSYRALEKFSPESDLCIPAFAFVGNITLEHYNEYGDMNISHRVRVRATSAVGEGPYSDYVYVIITTNSTDRRDSIDIIEDSIE